MKDTKHILRKIKSLGQLSKGAILCTIDVVALYPNIPHEEGLASFRMLLDVRTEKKVANETLIELAEFILKKGIFQFNEKTLNQSRGTEIGSKFAPPYVILFIANLEQKH